MIAVYKMFPQFKHDDTEQISKKPFFFISGIFYIFVFILNLIRNMSVQYRSDCVIQNKVQARVS